MAASPKVRVGRRRFRFSASRTRRSGCSKSQSAATITMPGDDGDELTLRIVGTFADSPFQSELVMADESFARRVPEDRRLSRVPRFARRRGKKKTSLACSRPVCARTA